MPGMSALDAMIAIGNEFPDAKFIILNTYTGDAQVTASDEGRRARLSVEKPSAQGSTSDHPGSACWQKDSLRLTARSIIVGFDFSAKDVRLIPNHRQRAGQCL
jgi:hypothetical protein